jgi:PGF-pre-PGF domain-containing protein/PGF-CTERM protein
MVSVRHSVVIALTISVVVGMAAPAIPVAAAAQDQRTGLDSSQVYEVSDGGQINAWDRAAFTLRTDDTGAATQVPAPSVVQGQKLGGGSFSKSSDDGTDSQSLTRDFDSESNPIGSHNSGEDVTATFDASYASGGTVDVLNEQENVDIVAARLTPQDGKEIPTTTDDALDLLSDVDNANANASFEMLKNGDSLDSNEQISATTSYSPGHYVIFAAVHEDGSDGFETDSENNISVDGKVTVIGADQLSVQKGKANVVEPTEPEPGDSLNFTVESFSLNPDNVTHAVALYEASKFENSRFDLVINESALGNDFNQTTDAELEHEIKTVNGVADVEDGLTLNGNELSDGTVRRPVDASTAVDFFADEAGVDDPRVDALSGAKEIDASVTAVNGRDHSADVSVDTFTNFTEGVYRYVAVSANDTNDSQFSTTTGTIEIFNRTSEATVNNGKANITFNNLAPVRSVNVSGAPDGTEINTTQSNSPTNTSAGSPPDTTVAAYVEISAENNNINSEVTVSTKIARENLTNKGIKPSDARLLHYTNSSWKKLDTTSKTKNDNVTLTATANGLSPFAIGGETSSGKNTIFTSRNNYTIDEGAGVSTSSGVLGKAPNVSIDGRDLTGVGFTMQTERYSYIRITERLAPSVEGPEDTAFVTGADVDFSFGGEEDAETVRIAFKRSRLADLDVTPSQLSTYYLNSDSEWEKLDTTIESENDTVVVVEAAWTGLSQYAVFTDSTEQTGVSTPVDITTPDETGTPADTAQPDDADGDGTEQAGAGAEPTTSGSGPGFTVVLALFALVATALLAVRRDS